MNEIEMKEKLESLLTEFDFSPKYQVNVMGRKIDVPIKYSDASAFMVFFSISFKKAKEILNSSRLSPVRIIGNKCLLGITFFNYRDCPVGPYHEFTLSIPVVVDTIFNIPIIPILFDSMFKNFGYYVILMGIDTDIARKHIEQIFPYPLFDKNISISLRENGKYLLADINDNGEKVISMRSSLPNKYKLEKKGFNTYYSKDDRIYKVRLNVFSYNKTMFRKKDLHLKFGDHKISKMMKGLDITPKPFMGIYYKNAIEFVNEPKEL